MHAIRQSRNILWCQSWSTLLSKGWFQELWVATCQRSFLMYKMEFHLSGELSLPLPLSFKEWEPRISHVCGSASPWCGWTIIIIMMLSPGESHKDFWETQWHILQQLGIPCLYISQHHPHLRFSSCSTSLFMTTFIHFHWNRFLSAI